MNSDEIYELLDCIADTNSTKVKVELLKEIPSELLFFILTCAYDPLISFGVKAVLPDKFGSKLIGGRERLLLDELRDRKLTGYAAVITIQETLESLTENSAQLLCMTINRDLECGIGVETINKAYPNLISKLGYMRCSLMSDVNVENWSWKEPHISQLKADGMFVNVLVSGKRTEMYTRTGHDLTHPAFDRLRKFFEEGYNNGVLGEDVIHGELLVVRDGNYLSRKEGNGILNSYLKNPEAVQPSREFIVMFVWDRIPKRVFAGEASADPYLVRFARLQQAFRGTTTVQVIDTRLVSSLEEAKAHYVEARAKGLEGTVLKHRDMPWKSGTSKYQIKMKGEYDCELRVIGHKEGTGKNATTFGSLLCCSEDGRVVCYVGGFDDATRMKCFEEGLWLDRIITVKFNDLIEDKSGEASLFLPRFVELREDKTEADTYETIKGIANGNV